MLEREVFETAGLSLDETMGVVKSIKKTKGWSEIYLKFRGGKCIVTNMG